MVFVCEVCGKESPRPFRRDDSKISKKCYQCRELRTGSKDRIEEERKFDCEVYKECLEAAAHNGNGNGKMGCGKCGKYIPRPMLNVLREGLCLQ